jgi:two-component system chemotaxis response regulator CheY
MKRSCLIVDDSRTVRKFARRIMEGMNFDIEEAADGALAMAECVRHMPDVILLDWNMPVMNGIEFLKKLRASEGGKKPVVLFCTTEDSMERISEAIKEGANEYVMKPFDGEILASKLSLEGLL